MCIMLTKPANVKLNREALYESYWSNSDGSGFAVASHGRLVVFRDHKISFHNFYEKLKLYEDCAMLIHFRLATHGGINEENTHPFILEGGRYAMAHNGIITIDSEKGESDSRAFIRQAITPYLKDYPDVVAHDKWQDYAEQAIGRWNKLAFINEKGEFFYVNKDSGVEDLGCWWSNTGYKTLKRVTHLPLGYPKEALDDLDNDASLAEEIYQRRRSRERDQQLSLATDAFTDDEKMDAEGDAYFSKLFEERKAMAEDFCTEGDIRTIEDVACCICNEWCEAPYSLDVNSGWAMCQSCGQTYAPGFITTTDESSETEQEETENADESGTGHGDGGVSESAGGADSAGCGDPSRPGSANDECDHGGSPSELVGTDSGVSHGCTGSSCGRQCDGCNNDITTSTAS